MKPIITVYSGGTPEETKKFEGYITAAFWIGLDHTDGDVTSVKIRQPNEAYDYDIPDLTEFTTLLVQRQINFNVEFFTEPAQQVSAATPEADEARIESAKSEEADEREEEDYERELTKMKGEYKKGTLTRRQYDVKKEALLRKWKEKVEGKLGK